ncbi:metal ABC transporter solute-binding protein, Zn/Mn family [Paenibacillus endoradicis]|uniref:metal ABC transporter solute-binding protein, Zn/Mn family n=1 Tax=Paenibacillus endoradicis TaxID=2972487 RepID=UPI0021599B06|nr:zinc ABC transporter substrate-binding protein [Paenibacillus endoradicis]MCR8659265.1 zinc ABC transporter substrate-binding protein [Paenibacillus endoradicis]
MIKKTSKRLSTLVIIAMIVMITGCGNDTGSTNASKDPSHIQVVTSFYPIYYLTKEIGGEQVDVTNLIATGVEPHDWTPKSKDLITASNADLLLYHGAGLETWIENFKQGLESDSKVKVKEVSVGMTLIDTASEEADQDHESTTEEEHDHDHATENDHDSTADEGHTHSHTTDPHTWVSPKSALVLASNIKDSLIEVDAEHAAQYEVNYNAIVAKLTSIDKQYTDALSNLTKRTIVVSHQSFGYVARDYNLEQISIMGLSPNAEPRAQDILEIAKTVKANDVKYIFFEELVSDNLAKMLASEAKVDTMVLYSLEGLTTRQEKAGEDYISLMELNLQNLVQALQ